MEKLDLRINFKTAISSDPKTIYKLLTTAKGWDSWFTRGMVFTLRKK